MTRTPESQIPSQYKEPKIFAILERKLPPESKEEITSRLRQANLIPTSIKALQEYASGIGHLEVGLFMKMIDFQTKISKLFAESQSVSNLYTDPEYKIGISDFRADIIGAAFTSFSIDSLDTSPDEVIIHIEEKLSAYNDLYGVYRKWVSQRGSYPQVMHNNLEVCFSQLLNDVNTLDDNEVKFAQEQVAGYDEILSSVEDEVKAIVNINWKWDWYNHDDDPYNTFFTYFTRYYIDTVGAEEVGELEGQDIIITESDLQLIGKSVSDSEYYSGRNDFPDALLITLAGGKKVDIRDYIFPEKKDVTIQAESIEIVSKTDSRKLLSQIIHHPDFPGKISKNEGRDVIVTESVLFDMIKSLKEHNENPGFHEFIVSTLGRTIVPGSKKSLDFVARIQETGILSRDESYTILWGEKGFQRGGISYSETIDTLGIADGALESITEIRGRELSQAEVENLIKFTKMALHCESSGGYNISNDVGASTAENIFQYLTGNGKTQPNGARLTNSYETALKRLPTTMHKKFPQFARELKNIGKPSTQSPKKLGAIEQLVLFYGDVYDQYPQRFEAILQGRGESALKMYGYQHHTNMDRATMDLLQEAYRDNYGEDVWITRNKDKTYAFSDTAPNFTQKETSVIISQTGGLTREIQPGDTPANFLIGLIKDFNKDTFLTQADVMEQLNSIERIPFPAREKVSIKRPKKRGFAYSILLNGQEILEITSDGKFNNI